MRGFSCFLVAFMELKCRGNTRENVQLLRYYPTCFLCLTFYISLFCFLFVVFYLFICFSSPSHPCTFIFCLCSIFYPFISISLCIFFLVFLAQYSLHDLILNSIERHIKRSWSSYTFPQINCFVGIKR